jgi:signal peptidase II
MQNETQSQTSSAPNFRLIITRWIVLLGTAATVLSVDQVTKTFVESHLAFGEQWEPIPFIADFFSITRSANTGAAFSLLPQLGDVFLIISMTMMIGILIFYQRMRGARWLERIALGLVLGGAAGNALDRIRLGYVVDFVHIQLRPIISNISNLADHAIVTGILILFVMQWRTSYIEVPQSKDSEERTDPSTPEHTS